MTRDLLPRRRRTRLELFGRLLQGRCLRSGDHRPCGSPPLGQRSRVAECAPRSAAGQAKFERERQARRTFARPPGRPESDARLASQRDVVARQRTRVRFPPPPSARGKPGFPREPPRCVDALPANEQEGVLSGRLEPRPPCRSRRRMDEVAGLLACRRAERRSQSGRHSGSHPRPASRVARDLSAACRQPSTK
jgi:hypothetical protein